MFDMIRRCQWVFEKGKLVYVELLCKIFLIQIVTVTVTFTETEMLFMYCILQTKPTTQTTLLLVILDVIYLTYSFE